MQKKQSSCCFPSQWSGPKQFSVTTLECNKIELVHTYRGVLIDDLLSFKPHVEKLKLKLKLRFYFQNNLCFSNAKKQRVAATFLPVLDYGDILYMNASAQCLQMVVTVYHASLRFITNHKFQTHHCELYFQVGWPALPVGGTLINTVLYIRQYSDCCLPLNVPCLQWNVWHPGSALPMLM